MKSQRTLKRAKHRSKENQIALLKSYVEVAQKFDLAVLIKRKAQLEDQMSRATKHIPRERVPRFKDKVLMLEALERVINEKTNG